MALIFGAPLTVLPERRPGAGPRCPWVACSRPSPADDVHDVGIALITIKSVTATLPRSADRGPRVVCGPRSTQHHMLCPFLGIASSSAFQPVVPPLLLARMGRVPAMGRSEASTPCSPRLGLDHQLKGLEPIRYSRPKLKKANVGGDSPSRRLAVRAQRDRVDSAFPARWLITSWNTSRRRCGPGPPPRRFVVRPDCGCWWWPAAGVGLAFQRKGFDTPWAGGPACVAPGWVSWLRRWRRPARQLLPSSEIAIGPAINLPFSPVEDQQGCRPASSSRRQARPGSIGVDRQRWASIQRISFVAPQKAKQLTHRCRPGTGVE